MMQIYGIFFTCKLFSAVFSKKTPLIHFYLPFPGIFVLTKIKTTPSTLDVFLIFHRFNGKKSKKAVFFENFIILTAAKKKVTTEKKFFIAAAEIVLRRWFRRRQNAREGRPDGRAGRRDGNQEFLWFPLSGFVRKAA